MYNEMIKAAWAWMLACREFDDVIAYNGKDVDTSELELRVSKSRVEAYMAVKRLHSHIGVPNAAESADFWLDGFRAAVHSWALFNRNR